MNSYTVTLITQTTARSKKELLEDIIKEIPNRYLMYFEKIMIEEQKNER